MSDSATPKMAAHQASPSVGFSRQEHWSGVPLPSLCLSIRSELICTNIIWALNGREGMKRSQRLAEWVRRAKRLFQVHGVA